MPSSFGTELVSHLPAMKAYALTFCKGDSSLADDIVQDAAESAYAGQRTFEIGSNMKSWLFTIIKNAAFRNFQKNKNSKNNLSIDDESFIEITGSAASQDSTRLLHEVEALMSHMPSDQRDVLVMVCINGLTMDEAADVLGVEPGTVKSRLHRGRERLLADMESKKVSAPESHAASDEPKSKRGRKARKRSSNSMKKLQEIKSGSGKYAEFVVDFPSNNQVIRLVA